MLKQVNIAMQAMKEMLPHWNEGSTHITQTAKLSNTIFFRL